MAEEYYQGETCGANSRWSTASIVAASSCSAGFNHHMGTFGCANVVDIIKSKSTFAGFGFNSSFLSTVTSDLNQHLLTGRGESNFHDSMNYDQDFSLDQIISRCFPSQLLHSLFDDSEEEIVPQPQQSLFNNVESSLTYSTSVAENYSTITSFSNTKANTNEDEPVFKRARIETPSSLPTFKVRKEKLGDRITALQQLVSPFGKTDTASVLHEAIVYIKFLHNQVGVLSTPYMNKEAPKQNHQGYGKSKDAKRGGKQELHGRGLCLVPISSTFAVANQTSGADFWTLTSFGVASFR